MSKFSTIVLGGTAASHTCSGVGDGHFLIKRLGEKLRRERKASERQCDENWRNCFVFGLSQWIHGSSFLFPRYVDSAVRGSGRGEEPSAEMSSA